MRVWHNWWKWWCFLLDLEYCTLFVSLLSLFSPSFWLNFLWKGSILLKVPLNYSVLLICSEEMTKTQHANSLPCSSPSCGFAPGITSLCGLPILSLSPADWPQSTFMALSVCGCVMLAASQHPALNQLRHLWEQVKSSRLQHCPVREHWTCRAENAVNAVLKDHFLMDTSRAAAVALIGIIVVVLTCSVAGRETSGDAKVLLKQDQSSVCLQVAELLADNQLLELFLLRSLCSFAWVSYLRNMQGMPCKISRFADGKLHKPVASSNYYQDSCSWLAIPWGTIMGVRTLLLLSGRLPSKLPIQLTW